MGTLVNTPIQEFNSSQEWVDSLLKNWRRISQDTLKNRGFFSVALAGGNTPKLFYQALTKELSEWENIHFFLGDERFVLPTDSQSNYRMACKALINHISIPKFNIHRWKTEKNPSSAAKEYEKELLKVLGTPPIFDLILLGIGDDGHTASLFPETSALAEKRRWAIENEVSTLNTTRLTLTFSTINHARAVWFLVNGQNKKVVLEQLQQPNCELPATKVNNQGELQVFYCP